MPADGCHRSPEAYGARLFQGIGEHWACTGAVTDDLFSAGPFEDPQAARLSSGTEIVTLTIGGNDIGFEGLIRACVDGFHAGSWGCLVPAPLAPSTPSAPVPRPTLTRMNAIDEAEERLNVLKGRPSIPNNPATSIDESLPKGPNFRNIHPLSGVLDKLKTAAPNAHIFIAGYPLPFGTNSETLTRVGDRKVCVVSPELWHTPLKYSVDLNDMERINALVRELNTAVKRAAKNAGPRVTFLSAVQATTDAAPFGGHGLCDNSSPWINGLNIDLSKGGPKTSSLHPRREGQCAYAEVFGNAIFRQGYSADCARTEPLTVPSEVYFDADKGTVAVPFYTLGPYRGTVTLHSRPYRRGFRAKAGWNRIFVRVGPGFRVGKHQLVVRLLKGARRQSFRRTVTVRTVSRRALRALMRHGVVSVQLTYEVVHIEARHGHFGFGRQVFNTFIGAGWATEPELVAVYSGPSGIEELDRERFLMLYTTTLESLVGLDRESGLEALERLSDRLLMWGFDLERSDSVWYGRHFRRLYLPLDRLESDAELVFALDAFLRERPYNTHALSSRAYCHKLGRRWWEALDDASRALSVRPTNIAALATSAEAMMYVGELGKARSLATRALQLDGEFAYAQSLLEEIGARDGTRTG